MEPKPLASLSSVLLARKGAARPAMRRPMAVNSGGAAALAQDDLGWNDMGYDVDPDPSTPMDYEHESMFNPLANAVPEVKPEVKLQQERIAEQLNVQAEALHEKIDIVAQVAPPIRSVPKLVKPMPRAAAGLKAKSAFTLRLDSERHLKLRLACALSHRSAQQLVTAALDQFLEAIPEVNQFASQLPTKNQCQSV
jgi:hypothetical protein